MAESEFARVVVIGVTGSGKTTLGRRLARAQGVPFVELDTLHWGPDWTATPDEEFASKIDAALAGERWVVDGSYSRVRDNVWGRATLVVWLRYPWWRSFGRLVRRTFRRVATREALYGGNRESLRTTLFDRDSILWWFISTHRLHLRGYAAALDGLWQHLPRKEFRHPDQAEAFARQLEALFNTGAEGR